MTEKLYLTPEQVEATYNIHRQTLANWRCTRRVPLPFTRAGRKVLYKRADIEAFLASRTVRPEAEVA